LINIGLSSKTNTQTKHMEDTVSSITKRTAYFSADYSNSDLILSSLVQNISLNGHNYSYRARVWIMQASGSIVNYSQWSY